MAASAARATLRVMEELDVPSLAAARGAYLAERLEGMSGVASVRGLGLLLGAELSGGNAREVASRCLEQGLIVNAVTATALRLEPPLLVGEEQIDEGTAILEKALGQP